VEFIINNIWLFGLVLISGGALLWPVLRQRGSKVSILQATQMINQGKTVVLDVREPAEFAAGHIREAKNIPVKELPKRVGELDKFKSKAVIVVCTSGLQSSKAASQLKHAGFNQVFSLTGGLAAWQAQGLPLAR
jgi:rhodanese-related sulfurtransferase